MTSRSDSGFQVQTHHLPLALMVMAVMPYLPGGMRLEHLLVPMLAFIVVCLSFHPLRRLHAPTLVGVAGLTLAALATLWGSSVSEQTGRDASALAMFIRLWMPTMMLAVFPWLLSKVERPLVQTARAIVLIGILAGLCSLASVFFDTSSFLAYWVQLEGDAVWAQALAVGRFTGLFNQPLEAGVFFSVALFAALYLFKVDAHHRVTNWAGLIFIITGGLLSLSKNFTILGLGLGVVLCVAIQVLTPASALMLALGSASLMILLVLQLNAAYADSLIDLFFEGGLLLALTAGRLGSAETEVSQLLSQLLEYGNWVLGFGLGSQLPLDNGYLEFFFQGGIFSLAGYLIFILALTWCAVRWRRHTEGKLLFVLVVFIVAASLGGPVITASRASIALVLLLSACISSMFWLPSSQIKASPEGKSK